MSFLCNHIQVEIGDDLEDHEALDFRGIPGWDKVDRLAKALIDIRGLSVTNNQARVIKDLYDDLLDFDKKPVTFSPRPLKSPRGRFARSKQYRVGSVGADHVKRCFLSAGTPFCSPAKSRLVEAICLHLCDRYSHARTVVGVGGKRQYTSRWKLIVSAYSAIRARLCNSYKLLEETNITLFNINATTLVKWYKNTSRRDEVKMLMQGILPPSADLTSQQPLLPAGTLPPGPLPAPMESHEFEEPEDTTGQARVRGTQSNPPLLPTTVVPTPANQTADWCHREKAAAASGSGSSSSSSTVAPTRPLLPTSTTTKQRKVYSCRICGKPMASPGHTQFRGQRYCPEQPGQMSKEEWLMLRRIEAKAKAATMPSP